MASSRYVQGSTARDIKRISRESRQASEENIRLVRDVRKTVQWSASYVIILSAIAILFVATIMVYVSLQSSVTNLRDDKGRLISQYEEAKVDNDLYYESIVSSVNIKEIERIAVEELGMKMAGNGQIMTYTNDIDDYVKQYRDMPN